MNYVLTVVLLLAIFLFASGIYRLERARASYEIESLRPHNLKHVLKGMLRTVEAEGSWEQLEFMRGEVRRALRTLDDMRHNHDNEALRASKQRLETGK
ncbi:MAG: hypothetical protein FD131_3311 [Rhodocyclaceae bacterium]|nr:MAG: hypothetical protein FD131_3311 [Rhodocyclaceae bacterium]